MNFDDLLCITGSVAVSSPAIGLEIGGISIDSRKVKGGDIFFAMPGLNLDGMDFISHARSRGAVCAVSETVPQGLNGFPIIKVDSAMKALSDISAAFYGHPSREMDVVGITGTNGKTTVTYLLESISKAAGKRSAVLGTIDYRVRGEVFSRGLTTPYPHELQMAIHRAKEGGAKYLFMEVSSHGIEQGRIRNIDFSMGLFTNLSRDHLDYHGSMENYFNSKKRFFTQYLGQGDEKDRLSVINRDSSYGERLYREIGGGKIGYSLSGDAHVSITNPDFSINGIEATLSTPEGECRISSTLIGKHNLENIAASAATAYGLGFKIEDVSRGISLLESIPGRLERVCLWRGAHVFVDYAHTPDGLRNVLLALQPFRNGRLIVIFGCGGDRDRGKREKMGEVACYLADLAVVTSDNPRSEDPMGIIHEIIPGCERSGARETRHIDRVREKGKRFFVEEDRKRAIASILEVVSEGDIVVIAGKGHETYQIVGDKILDFDDREVVRSLCRDEKSGNKN